MVFGITALQFHWAALRSVGSFIVVAAHLQCHVGFWMSAASTQARPLWCITKPFFTSFLLCWSIITTVAERCHTLLHGVSININVSSTNHHGWLSRCVCVWVRVWASVYVLAGAHVGVYVNAAVRQLNACALLRAWHQGKMKRPGE